MNWIEKSDLGIYEDPEITEELTPSDRKELDIWMTIGIIMIMVIAIYIIVISIIELTVTIF